jgi:hypothetical protein
LKMVAGEDEFGDACCVGEEEGDPELGFERL